MVDFALGILVWAVIGGIPGFYTFLAKRRNPRHGVLIGALLGIMSGNLGVEQGVVPSFVHAIVLMIEVWIIVGLLMPTGTYDQEVTARERISHLAYGLLIPTALIVIGVVVFPLLWNLIFSVRPIDVADLLDAELFDLTEFTLDNYDSQLGFRIDIVPCATVDDVPVEDGGECIVNEDGETEYVDPRRYFDDYRGYRAANEYNLFGQHLVIGVQDREFYPMIWRSLFYTVTGTLGAILLGLVAALLVREVFPGRAIFRGFILFPYIAPVISVAFVWQVLLRTNGFVNGLFDTNTAFLSTRDQWLGIDIPLIMAILFQIWRYFPFAFLFLLARIQAIPDDMYEAAKVDGAAPSQRLWSITLPQLRAVFGTLFLLRFIWTFNKFDDIYLLTGPITQTKIIPIQIFEALFTNGDIGQASAIAVIMAAILAVVVLIYFRWFLVEET